MSVAETLRRKRKITSTTSAMVRSSVNFTSWTESRIDCRAVVEDVQVDRGRQLLAELRAGALEHAVHHLDGVGAGLPLDGQHDRALVVEPAGDLVVLHAVDDAAELLQAHRRAVAIGDDHRAVGRRVDELAGGLHGEGLVRAVQRAGGQVDVGAARPPSPPRRCRCRAWRARADRAARAPRTSASRRPSPAPRR